MSDDESYPAEAASSLIQPRKPKKQAVHSGPSSPSAEAQIYSTFAYKSPHLDQQMASTDAYFGDDFIRAILRKHKKRKVEDRVSCWTEFILIKSNPQIFIILYKSNIL